MSVAALGIRATLVTATTTASAIAALVTAVIAALVAPPGHAAPRATPMAH